MIGFSIPFSRAFNSICIGLLFLYSFIWFKKNSFISLFESRFNLYLLFLIYFIIQILGVFYSDDVNGGFNYLKKNIVFLILPIAFINVSKILDYTKVKLSIYGLVASVTIILLSIHVNVLSKILSSGLGLETLFTEFVRVDFVQRGLVEIHPPYFGLLVVFSIVAVLALKLFKNQISTNVIRYSLAAYFIFSLYGISSFMAVVLLGVLFLFYTFILFKRKKLKTLFLIYTLLLLSIFTIFSFLNLNEKNLDKFSGNTLIGRVVWSFYKGKGDTSRPENWKSVFMVVKDNLWFGIGSDGGVNYLQKYRSQKSESFKNKYNAHNQYLETLLRHGMLGLIVFLWIIYRLAFNAKRSNSIIFTCFVIIFVISSMTESYLVRQIGLTFFTFFALLFNAHYSFGFYRENNI